MRKIHFLKIRKEFFVKVLDGVKAWEHRKDDRGFCCGDYLMLEEWEPQGGIMDAGTGGEYTGRKILSEVLDVQRQSENVPIASGHCVMSIKPLAVN